MTQLSAQKIPEEGHTVFVYNTVPVKNKLQKAEIRECADIRTWSDDRNLQELCRYLF